MGSKLRVLVICVHNSARSQMAEEYIRKLGSDYFEVESAGLEPGKLNRYVVAALREEGIDISGKKTQSVFDLWKAGRAYDFVIAVCSKEAEERCPIFPGPVVRLAWPFADPSQFTGTDAEIMARVRDLRDDIRETARAFVDERRARTKEG